MFRLSDIFFSPDIFPPLRDAIPVRSAYVCESPESCDGGAVGRRVGEHRPHEHRRSPEHVTDHCARARRLDLEALVPPVALGDHRRREHRSEELEGGGARDR